MVGLVLLLTSTEYHMEHLMPIKLLSHDFGWLLKEEKEDERAEQVYCGSWEIVENFGGIALQQNRRHEYDGGMKWRYNLRSLLQRIENLKMAKNEWGEDAWRREMNFLLKGKAILLDRLKLSPVELMTVEMECLFGIN